MIPDEIQDLINQANDKTTGAPFRAFPAIDRMGQQFRVMYVKDVIIDTTQPQEDVLKAVQAFIQGEQPNV